MEVKKFYLFQTKRLKRILRLRKNESARVEKYRKFREEISPIVNKFFKQKGPHGIPGWNHPVMLDKRAGEQITRLSRAIRRLSKTELEIRQRLRAHTKCSGKHFMRIDDIWKKEYPSGVGPTTRTTFYAHRKTDSRFRDSIKKCPAGKGYDVHPKQLKNMHSALNCPKN